VAGDGNEQTRELTVGYSLLAYFPSCWFSGLYMQYTCIPTLFIYMHNIRTCGYFLQTNLFTA
jgi:hypothetical protein